ncbi:abortive infection system antitoxin AbiGi family protein [Pseudoalteromonas sp. SG43-7]|uniref:abortive infection system antitoxin AbiGi family protein n=1 Tax=Pseudoalteromonas sp. SG43-7 TaxID=2760966 RepID=UPI003857F38E
MEKYRFADEREWRYVPPLDNSSLSLSINNSSSIAPFVPISSIKTEKQKRELNSSISHIGLHFEPEDIRYLIVERDDEISELITHLEEVKGRFNQQTRDRLKSRILTAEQINLDI